MRPRSRSVSALLFAVPFLVSAQINVAAEAASASLADASSASAVSASVDDLDVENRLRKGEVVVDLIEDESTKFVVGKILIHKPPSQVWPVLVNPFEFQGKICPRMKKVEVLQDEVETSVLRCSLTICFPFPSISYTVESKYDADSTVEFKRVSGFLKDFRGCWLLRPRDDGNATEVFYSMFVDPGIPVPKWIVREGVKTELPRTLTGLRDRVEDIAAEKAQPEPRTIMAASAARSKLQAQAQPLTLRKGSI